MSNNPQSVYAALEASSQGTPSGVAPQQVPQEGVVAPQQVSGQLAPDQQGTQPTQPQFQPVEPGKLDFSGLEQVLPATVIDDIKAQAESYAQHHIRQLQSKLDQQIAQHRQAALQAQQQLQQQRQTFLQQQLRQLPPDQQQQAVLQMQQHELQQRAQALRAYEQQQQEAMQRQQDIQALTTKYEGVTPQDLADCQTYEEALERAASLYWARRVQSQVPVRQPVGPTGGGQPALTMLPNADSPDFDRLVMAMKQGYNPFQR